MLVREFYMRTVEEAGAGKLSQLLAASECDGAGVRVLVHLLSEEHHLGEECRATFPVQRSVARREQEGDEAE